MPPVSWGSAFVPSGINWQNTERWDWYCEDYVKTLFGKTIDIVQKALELRSKRNALLASNIANVDTPGYKQKDIDFRKIMDGYMKEMEAGRDRISKAAMKGSRVSF
ncbi:MAG: flagellar basal body rod protein FlgB, partial [Thermodesulfatator sp.]